MKSKSRIMIGLSAVALIMALLFPIPIDADAQSSREVTVDNSFLKCCQLLAQTDAREQLIAATVKDKSTLQILPLKNDPTDDTQSTLQTTLLNLLKGSFQRSESFLLKCDSDLGPLELTLRQDTELKSGRLSVTTKSMAAGPKLQNYVLNMQLLPAGSTVVATLEMQLKVRVYVPWTLQTLANERLKTAVDQQLASFAEALKTLLDKKSN